MPFCPQCRGEFQDWVEVCIDCGIPLVDTLPEPELTPEPKVIISSEPLVTIATFSYPLQAHLNRAKLESEGIKAFVVDEHIINANWLYSIAIGGVKLQVAESDAEKALEILEKIPKRIPEEADISAEIGGDERCPKCKSIDIHYEMFHIRPLFVLWLFLSFTFPFLKRKWKCHSCGYEWKEAKEKVKTPSK